MRKCINLESQPGFQQIYSPVLQQAIDRGLEGHSGTGKVDWGYLPPSSPTKPMRKIKGKAGPAHVIPPAAKKDDHYKVVNAVTTGSDTYFDYLFNTFGTPEMRALINKYPKVPIVIERRGYFASGEGIHGTVHARKGSRHDEGTLFHEYGHALDHMIGTLTGANDRIGQTLGHSQGFVDDFLTDGVKMGMLFDDSAYWDYITETGLKFHITTSRHFSSRKGDSRQQVESRMKPGDHWRIMVHLLQEVNNDLAKITNTKNPDPVKVKRAEEMKARMEKLHDQHTKRVEVAIKITKAVKDALNLGPSIDNKWYQAGSIADILDGLSGGEIFDYAVATHNDVLLAGHPPGYFSMRQETNGSPRNYSPAEVIRSARVEIFAQFFQFYYSQDKTAYNLLKELMPQTEKKFLLLMKEGIELKV